MRGQYNKPEAARPQERPLTPSTTPDQPAPRRHKLMSIQYTRAVAALAVVVWHTGWARTALGQSGVDAFFVVSGFVMMLVSGRENSPPRFGLLRITRIVPLYWAVTAVAAWLDKPSPSDLLASLFFWPDHEFPVVIQGWSLNLEMSYYLLFALSLLAPGRWRVAVLAAEMVALCIVLPALFTLGVPLAAWSSPLAFEFLAGAVLFLLWQREWLPVGWAAWVMFAAGVIVLAASHLLGGAPAGWTRLAFWGVPAFAIVAGGLGIEAAGQLPRSRLLGTLGEASYAIYLTHFIALGVVAGLLHQLWAPLAVVLVIAWACLIGWLVHRGFELPMHRASKMAIALVWRRRQPRTA